MRKLKRLASTLAAAALISGTAVSIHAKGDPAPVARTVDAKPLSKNVARGLDWLARHQLKNGAWGQGDEAASMGQTGDMRDVPSVADTSMAVLAYLRAGHTASRGEYKDNVRRGLEYVMSEIESSDKDSLYVTQTRGTRVQGKIGTYVDTFTALLVLTEAKGTMPDQDANSRLGKALAKVLSKIEKNQQKDGTWANQGWAPVLTQSVAAKGLNRAVQSGEKVDENTIKRVEDQAHANFDARSGAFAPSANAGVDLYSTAAGTSALSDSANTRQMQAAPLQEKVKEAKTEAERAKYAAELRDGQRTQASAESAQKALIGRVQDPGFIRGFGSNGGEEFLSYMLMSEALAAKGGAEWKKWDDAITQLVDGVQNQDGSWTGHHCITGRTFCTAAAMLVLMADRAPLPIAGKLKG
ncbi:MAG TPA: prenyltransferase/squalene oxidase repeat-containing protein [Haliangiales bacterium]|nr:prenyltransferase/squalene oxidase repeat-containing protein [Haliangiales bacterium]